MSNPKAETAKRDAKAAKVFERAKQQFRSDEWEDESGSRLSQTTPLTIQDMRAFLELRPSQQRDLAVRFDLDLSAAGPMESNFKRSKGWLLEAKALGRMHELLEAAKCLIR